MALSHQAREIIAFIETSDFHGQKKGTERLAGSGYSMDELFSVTLSSKDLGHTERLREVLYAREVI